MHISDSIATFIKELLTEENNSIDIRRNELAAHFSCAPSQINYVLATRFTPKQGYIVQSQRGGGGYIRIVQVQMDNTQNWLSWFLEELGTSVSFLTAKQLVANMAQREMITPKEASLMLTAVSPKTLALPMADEKKDILRAQILKSMVLEAVTL